MYAFLEQNYNQDVWQVSSIAEQGETVQLSGDVVNKNSEDTNDSNELQKHINILTEKLKKDLADDSNNKYRIATIQMKLRDCSNILPNLSNGVPKKDMTKAITTLLKKNIIVNIRDVHQYLH